MDVRVDLSPQRARCVGTLLHHLALRRESPDPQQRTPLDAEESVRATLPECKLMACVYGTSEVFVRPVIPVSHQLLSSRGAGFRLGHQLAFRLTIRMLESLDLTCLRFPVTSFPAEVHCVRCPWGFDKRLPLLADAGNWAWLGFNWVQSSESSTFDCNKAADLQNTTSGCVRFACSLKTTGVCVWLALRSKWTAARFGSRQCSVAFSWHGKL